MSNARRSQGRRSSNTLPIRPLPGGSSRPSTTLLSSSTMSSSQKRSSSIPRPSFSSSVPKPNYGQNQNQSLAYGTTPSKAPGAARYSTATPQMGSLTPQSRGNLINMSATAGSKPFLKETRNLSDKTCLLDMMKNVANFLSDMGFPDNITPKEIQKIDKQSFIKYFNFAYQFIDPNFQLGPRFNEDDLIKNLKELGYCGTLAKSALVSIGALHSTSQIVGLLSWLCDFVRLFNLPPPEEEESIEKIELNIMMHAYHSWCLDQSVDLTEEFRALYKEKHQVEDGRAEMILRQIQAVYEEREALEKKNSQADELKEEAKKWDHKLDEIISTEAQLQQKAKELKNEEKHMIQRLDETKEKMALAQKEIAELVVAAKNCKVSADEARRIKAEIAANKRDHAAASEQRAQVAKLVEKREMQLANIAAEDVKFDRELNVDLMDMGMTSEQNVDRKEALKNFLDCKTTSLSEIESQCIAMTERKERVLAEISQLKMELKHSEHLKSCLEEKIQSAKADRDEMERLYLSQLAELENLSAGPRSDPLQMRHQYELETLQQKDAEQKALMEKQEKELQMTMAKFAKELEDGEAYVEGLRSKAIDYYGRLAIGYQQALAAAEQGPIQPEVLKAMLPANPFIS